MKTASSRPESLFVSRMRLVSVGILALTLPGISDFAAARALSNYAVDIREDLGDKILPYWHATTLDKTNGGYVLADDVEGRRRATEKHLVTQTRRVCTFSLCPL